MAVNDVFGTDVKRRGKYRFGKAQVQFYIPSEGYPTAAQAAEKPSVRLELDHVYGYNATSRQNVLSKDGKVIYYLAAAGIVYDVETNTQKFFLEHNDDLTTICLDPREGSTLVATGQKDPKDQAGKGKDLPKIWVWDTETMEPVVLLDRVCVNLIRRVRWSPASGILYVICGDDGQSIKAYNLADLKSGSKADAKACNKVMLDKPTTRQKILGVAINPKPKDCVDELVFFCTGKLLVVQITDAGNGKLNMGKMVAITVSKGKEKAFLDAKFFPSGRFVVGGATGHLYFCEGTKLMKDVKNLHKKSVFSIGVQPSRQHVVLDFNGQIN